MVFETYPFQNLEWALIASSRCRDHICLRHRSLPQLCYVSLHTEFRGRRSLCKGRDRSFPNKPRTGLPALTTVVGGYLAFKKILWDRVLFSTFSSHLSPTYSLSASIGVGFEKWDTNSKQAGQLSWILEESLAAF